MLRAPFYSVTFTLLYGDPDIKEELPYLQPLHPLLDRLERAGSADADSVKDKVSARVVFAGPQPVFRGAILLDDKKDDDAADGPATPFLVHRDGTPYLATLLNEAHAARVGALYKPYPAPCSRSGALCVSCGDRGTLLLHGGLHDAACADTWEYDVRTRRWHELRCTAAATASGGTESDAAQLPPPAYGQAGAIYHDDDGAPQLLVLGGFLDNDMCSSTLYALCLRTQQWRVLETTVRFPRMWGATAQTLLQPRDDEGWEEVVVFFGGTTRRCGIRAMFIVHPCRVLTEEEVFGNVKYYLDSVQYAREENWRIIRSIPGLAPHPDLVDSDDDDDAGEDESGKWRVGPSEYDMDGSVRSAVLRWRETHEATLQRWRQERLEQMVGKVWVECLSLPPALLERRRPCSGVYRKHFMFVFGGRHHAFYNDFWVFNVVTRDWVQIRAEVPRHLLQRFFAQPRSRAAAERIHCVLDHTREAQGLHPSRSGDAIGGYSFYASRQNSSAVARTGACMVVDVARRCVYVYGGYTLSEGKQYIFRDLHAYYIDHHVWRRLYVASRRPWEAQLDMVGGTTHTLRLEGVCGDAEVEARVGGSSAATTVMGPISYFARLPRLAHWTGPDSTLAPSDPVIDTDYPPPLHVTLPRTSHGKDKVTFTLPVLFPAARTMACLVDDPIVPGSRFFLLGGRQDDVVYGDLFEMRVRPFRELDQSYYELQVMLSQRARSGQSLVEDAAVERLVRTLQARYVADYRDRLEDDDDGGRNAATAAPVRLVEMVGRMAKDMLTETLHTEGAARASRSQPGQAASSLQAGGGVTPCNLLGGHLALSLRMSEAYSQSNIFHYDASSYSTPQE